MRNTTIGQNNGMRRIDLSDMKDILKDMSDGYGSERMSQEAKFYLSNNFGISIGVTNFFHSVMSLSEPVLVDDFRLGMLVQGEVDVTVNLIDYRLRPGTVAYLGSGSIVQATRASENVVIKGIIMRDDFLNIALHGRVPAVFSGDRLNFYAEATTDECRTIESILQTIWDVVHQENANRETVYGLVSALVHYYSGIAKRDSTQPGRTMTREREVFERFIALVNEHCREHRTLSFYADRLCMTERYLGTLIKQASGYTAKEWIDRAVITTAKVMLRHTNKQVTQIADELNFPNNSFFNKFFRRLTGKTPVEYRKS